MAGTVTVTSKVVENQNSKKAMKVVTVAWVADASNGSVPDTSIPGLFGYVVKAITNPGSTAPTDNYDIKLLDPEDSTADALAGLLADRDTANTETVIPTGAVPPYLCGTYTFNLSGNSVNSATGVCKLFILECL